MTITINGTLWDDVLLGGDGPEIIDADAGNDLVRAGGGNDSVWGGYGDDRLAGNAGNDMLFGGEGSDSVNYDASNSAVVVNLATGIGYETGLGKLADADQLISIENVEGSKYADYILGDSGENHLSGWYGNDNLAGGQGLDILDGGSGIDTADYAASAKRVIVDLSTGESAGGDAKGDTLLSIENVTGTAFNDIVTGDGGANSIAGNAGNDQISGGGGNDVLDGGYGSDILNGGSGNDMAAYWHSALGVAVDLATGKAGFGEATFDTLVGIEGVYGSMSGDQLTGNGVGNILYGLDGADNIAGRGGNDTLLGGYGGDTMAGGANEDVLTGGAGRDVISGGAGYDSFVFGGIGLGEVGHDAADRDVVADFKHGDDVIDLKGLDADMWVAGNQAFDFIGSSAFTHAAGELRFFTENGRAVIEGDVNSDAVADFQIELTGVQSMVFGDFIL